MSCYCDSLHSGFAVTDGIKFKKDFVISATHNVRVLVEVCSYSFEGGRNLASFSKRSSGKNLFVVSTS